MGVIVAVDGPAGSGKSSVSRAAAASLGYSFLDTGAAYRALAWAVLEQGGDPEVAPTSSARSRASRSSPPTTPLTAGSGSAASTSPMPSARRGSRAR